MYAKRKKTKGSVLYTVVSVMMVLFVFVMVTLALAKAGSDRARNDYSRQQALYTARSVADIISEKLNTQGDELGAKSATAAFPLSCSPLEPGMGTLVNPYDTSEENIVWVIPVATDKAGTDNFINGSGENIYQIRVAVKYGSTSQIAEYSKFSAPARAVTTTVKSKGGLVSYGTFGTSRILDNASVFKSTIVSMAINKIYSGTTSQTVAAYEASPEFTSHGQINSDYAAYDTKAYEIRNQTTFYDSVGFYSQSLNFNNNQTFTAYMGFGQSIQIHGHCLSDKPLGIIGPQEMTLSASDFVYGTNYIPNRTYDNLPIFFTAGVFSYRDFNSSNDAGIRNVRLISGQVVIQSDNLAETKYLTSNADFYCYQDYDSVNRDASGNIKYRDDADKHYYAFANNNPVVPPNVSDTYVQGLSRFIHRDNTVSDSGQYMSKSYSILDWCNELKDTVLLNSLPHTGGNFYSLGRLEIGRPMTFEGVLAVEDGIDANNIPLTNSELHITVEKGLFTDPSKCNFGTDFIFNGVHYPPGFDTNDPAQVLAYINAVNTTDEINPTTGEPYMAVELPTYPTVDAYMLKTQQVLHDAFTARYVEGGVPKTLSYDGSTTGQTSGFGIVEGMLKGLDGSVKVDEFFKRESTGLILKYVVAADGTIKYDRSGVSATSDKAAVTINAGDKEYYQPQADPRDAYIKLLKDNGHESSDTITFSNFTEFNLGNFASFPVGSDNENFEMGALNRITLTGVLPSTGNQLYINPVDPGVGNTNTVFINLINVVLGRSLVFNTNEGRTNVILYVPAEGEATLGDGSVSNGIMRYIDNGDGIFTKILYGIDTEDVITDVLKDTTVGGKYFPSIYFYMNGPGQIIRGANFSIYHGFYNAAYASLEVGQSNGKNSRLNYELTDNFATTYGTPLAVTGRNARWIGVMYIVGSASFGEIVMPPSNNATIGFYYIDAGEGQQAADPNTAARPLNPVDGFDLAY